MPAGSRSSGQGRSFIEAARRAQIVQCTIDTIAAHGYAHTSLAQIAERAGVSKGVISYHFAGKDELIAQVYADVMRAAADAVLPRLTGLPRAPDKLRAYIEGSVAFVASHAAHSTALLEIWNGLRTPDGKPVLDARSYEPGLDLLQDICRQGQADGDFRPFAPRMMAVTIRAAIDGVMVQRATYGDQVDLDEAARELVALFDAATRRAASV